MPGNGSGVSGGFGRVSRDMIARVATGGHGESLPESSAEFFRKLSKQPIAFRTAEGEDHYGTLLWVENDYLAVLDADRQVTLWFKQAVISIRCRRNQSDDPLT